MDMKEVDSLRPGDIVIDVEGNEHRFIRADKDGDLEVECRAALGGYITLYASSCSLPVQTEVRYEFWLIDPQNRPCSWGYRSDRPRAIERMREIKESMEPKGYTVTCYEVTKRVTKRDACLEAELDG